VLEPHHPQPIAITNQPLKKNTKKPTKLANNNIARSLDNKQTCGTFLFHALIPELF
jgi:hypothetical protein